MLLLVFTLLPHAFIYAQDDDSVIEYGSRTKGEITNRNFEIEYQFEGTSGDIVAIQVIPDDAFSGLSNVVIILLDEDFNVIEDVSGSLATTSLFYRLRENAQYNIIVSRRNGRSGDAQGAYTLLLTKIDLLRVGERITGSATTDTTSFYAVIADTVADLIYEKTGGTFAPNISINIIKEGFGDNNLTKVVSLEGDELERVAVRIPRPGILYIISVGEALFDFNFTEKTVLYSLELVAAD